MKTSTPKPNPQNETNASFSKIADLLELPYKLARKAERERTEADLRSAKLAA